MGKGRLRVGGSVGRGRPVRRVLLRAERRLTWRATGRNPRSAPFRPPLEALPWRVRSPTGGRAKGCWAVRRACAHVAHCAWGRGTGRARPVPSPPPAGLRPAGDPGGRSFLSSRLTPWIGIRGISVPSCSLRPAARPRRPAHRALARTAGQHQHRPAAGVPHRHRSRCRHQRPARPAAAGAGRDRLSSGCWQAAGRVPPGPAVGPGQARGPRARPAREHPQA